MQPNPIKNHPELIFSSTTKVHFVLSPPSRRQAFIILSFPFGQVECSSPLHLGAPEKSEVASLRILRTGRLWPKLGRPPTILLHLIIIIIIFIVNIITVATGRLLGQNKNLF